MLGCRILVEHVRVKNHKRKDADEQERYEAMLYEYGWSACLYVHCDQYSAWQPGASTGGGGGGAEFEGGSSENSS